MLPLLWSGTGVLLTNLTDAFLQARVSEGVHCRAPHLYSQEQKKTCPCLFAAPLWVDQNKDEVPSAL